MSPLHRRIVFGRALRRVPAALVCLTGLGCTTDPGLPAGAQVLGSYGSCVVRVGDTCHEPDGGCATLPAESRTFVFGAGAADGGERPFLVAREGLPPLEGVLRGTRFEVVTTVALPSLCSCAAGVTETITGELLPNPIGELEECAPRAVDGGTTCGPAPEVAPPDAGPSDGGSVEPFDLARRYPAVSGRIVSEAVAADADAGCACLPCRAEFEFLGRL